MKFIAVTAHNATSDRRLKSCETLDKALDIVTEHAKSYGIVIKDGKLYDEENDTFDSLTGVIKNGKIFSYMHADGDGPIGYVHKSE